MKSFLNFIIRPIRTISNKRLKNLKNKTNHINHMKNFKGLLAFGTATMMERFAFYTLMSVFYLSILDRGFDEETTGLIYSIFYSSVFFSVLIMGIVGDFIDRRKVATGGLILAIIGYFLHAVNPGTNMTMLILTGLLVSLGTGAFKINLIVQIGDLYKNNIRRGSIGYIIYYLFINLGALFAPFVAKGFKEFYGDNSVFIVAGIAAIIALVLYRLTPVLPKDEISSPTNEPNETIQVDFNENAQNIISETPSQKKYSSFKLTGLLFLFILAPIFFVAFNQTTYTFSFFIKDYIQSFAFSQLQGVNPWFVVAFSIIVVLIIRKMKNIKNYNQIIPIIGVGMLIAAIAFFIPAVGISISSTPDPIIFAIIPIAFFSLTEVLVSPLMSLGVYHYAPVKFKGLFFGIFTIMGGIANVLLFLYGSIYYDKGAEFTLKSIAIQILICALIVFIFWMIRKKHVKQIDNIH